MLQRRTDLAVEEKVLREGAGALSGVESYEREREGFSVTEVRVVSPSGALALGKPMGTYVTLEMAPLKRRESDAFGRGARAIAAEISKLLKPEEHSRVLVVGLGNRAVTPDAVGPMAIGHTLATRHLVEQLPDRFGDFRSVCAVAAGVLGNTGVESGELVQALCGKVRPDAVIAIDALASRALSRVCTTVQIADTGIVPGSGVGNARAALDRKTLGVPVIAVGVPTVVAEAMVACGVGEDGCCGCESSAMVTNSSLMGRSWHSHHSSRKISSELFIHGSKAIS